MRRLVTVLVASLTLAGCSDSQPTSPPTSAVSNVKPAALSAEKAMIDTRGNDAAACDDRQDIGEPGDCYLPANYTKSTNRASRMELVATPGASCPLDDKETIDDQSQCWPQSPGEVTVVCQERVNSELFYGFAVPRERFANPSAADDATPVPGDPDHVIGYNLAIFMELVYPERAASLANCPADPE